MRMVFCRRRINNVLVRMRKVYEIEWRNKSWNRSIDEWLRHSCTIRNRWASTNCTVFFGMLNDDEDTFLLSFHAGHVWRFCVCVSLLIWKINSFGIRVMMFGACPRWDSCIYSLKATYEFNLHFECNDFFFWVTVFHLIWRLIGVTQRAYSSIDVKTIFSSFLTHSLLLF